MPERPGARTATCRIWCSETSTASRVSLGSIEAERNVTAQVLIGRGWGFGSATVRASDGSVGALVEPASM